MPYYIRNPDGTYTPTLDSAIISSNTAIDNTDKIWFDTTVEKPKIYNPNKSKWGFIKYAIGYLDFDNNVSGGWSNYIYIPITSPPIENIQYKIEINRNNIYIYSNNGTTTILSGTGVSEFWSKVDVSGKDLRIFDETFGQNYFWIEKFDYINQKCIIWCKLCAGQEQLNIAYGNNDCLNSVYHNGEQVFMFFDDFAGTELDTTKWIYSGNNTISNSILTLGDESYIYANYNLPQKLIIEAHIINTNHSSYTGLGVYSHYGNMIPHFNNNGYGFGIYGYSTPGWMYDSVNSTGNRHCLNKDYIEPLNLSLIYDGTTSYWTSEVGEWNQVLNLDITNYKLKIASGGYSDNSYIKVDYIYIRKYTNQDISFGTPLIKKF